MSSAQLTLRRGALVAVIDSQPPRGHGANSSQKHSTMNTTTPQQHSAPAEKRNEPVARRARIPKVNCRVMSSADFLHNPKLAVGLVARGTQVCVQGVKTKIIFASRYAKVQATQRKLHRAPITAKLFTRSAKASEPLNLSWIE